MKGGYEDFEDVFGVFAAPKFAFDDVGEEEVVVGGGELAEVPYLDGAGDLEEVVEEALVNGDDGVDFGAAFFTKHCVEGLGRGGEVGGVVGVSKEEELLKTAICF